MIPFCFVLTLAHLALVSGALLWANRQPERVAWALPGGVVLGVALSWGLVCARGGVL